MENYNSEELILACSKFEKCKYRSINPKIKKSCCSSKTIESFACLKRKIFPLVPMDHCFNCADFIDMFLEN